MKVHRRPQEFEAILFVPGGVGDTETIGEIEIRHTWPGPGAEPRGVTPYSHETVRKRIGHREVWDLHASGFLWWTSTVNAIVGVKPGDWIIFYSGSAVVEDVVSEEIFERRYKEHR